MSISKGYDVLNNAQITFELVFVDDGSSDSTWNTILTESNKYPTNLVRGIKFSRNFGKEAAIIAGMKHSNGECAVVMDCDLQHPPEKIVEMHKLWRDGYEIIEGHKISRGKESILHKLCANSFYSVLSKAAGFDMKNASDFKLLDKQVINIITAMPEQHSFFRALTTWVGFKTAVVTFDVQDREFGETKWTTKSLIKYAINNITSFSTSPLQLVTILGVIIFLVTTILSLTTIIQKITGKALPGFTTVILIQLFTSGVLMVSLGIIGYYIAKIYEEVKSRPRYIIESSIGDNDE